MRRPAFALGLLLALGGCGGSEDGAPRFEIGEESRADPFGEGLSALRDEPAIGPVLTLLGPSHANLRERVGPHTLTYEATYELGPKGKELPRPKVGQPIPLRQNVSERLRLDWASEDESNPRFALSQSTGLGEQREVVVADERVHVRETHRGWFHRPRETDIVERWLDDAAWGPRDALAFVAPQAAVEMSDAGEGARLTFSLAGERRAALATSGPRSEWRAGAEFQTLVGELELAADGTWRRLELDASYTVEGPMQTLHGHFHMEAKLEPGTPSVDVPEDSQPVPERVRLEVERDELLQGLRGL